MGGNVQWIERTEELAGLVPDLVRGPLALDAEGDSLHHYPEKVCLIQLSFRDRDVILDPLTRLDLSPLAPVLSDGSVRKVLHGADYDLRVLHRDFGFVFDGLFDTMIAARLTGERAFGLASLLERFFGVRLDKRFQRADWSRRPLTPEMIEYAALDTRHLEDLAARLEDRLDGQGRLEWAREEFRLLESVRWREADDPEAFRRIKGAARLDRAGLAILRSLHALREREARRIDRPPFRVMGNEVLLSLAEQRPADRDTLRATRGLPGRWSGGERADRLLFTIAEALASPPEDWPDRKRGGRPRSNPDRDREIKRLARIRDGIAEELDLEPSLILPRVLLEEVADRRAAGDPLDGSLGWRCWQRDLLAARFER